MSHTNIQNPVTQVLVYNTKVFLIQYLLFTFRLSHRSRNKECGSKKTVNNVFDFLTMYHLKYEYLK